MNMQYDPTVESREEAAQRRGTHPEFLIPDVSRPGAMAALGYMWVGGAWQRCPDAEAMRLRTLAVRLAYRFHGKQTRRDGMTPYAAHLEAVAQRVAGDLYDEMAAWLHDILEDTKATPGDLLNAGVPSEVVDAVMVLTRGRGVPYRDYIARVRVSNRAKRVKLADIMAATGISKAFASHVRAGKSTPHMSTWLALARLAGAHEGSAP